MAATPEVAENFRAVPRGHTAGSPVEPDLIGTDLTAADAARGIGGRGTPASVHVAGQPLDEFDHHRREAREESPVEAHEGRDLRFRTTARSKQQHRDSGDPIPSIDAKKRELVGDSCRPGVLLTGGTLSTSGHDYPSFARGVVIPHGLYDPRLNRGYVRPGASREASEFARDCLEDWRPRFGRARHPGAKSLPPRCDGGGSNGASARLPEAGPQTLADELGPEARAAHYPPRCSKYDPIERRRSCHLSRACRGMIFASVGLVKRLMGAARTRAGLRVVVGVVDEVYEAGRKVAEGVGQGLNIIRDAVLPKSNYRTLPRLARA